jgi:hypothetical protein
VVLEVLVIRRLELGYQPPAPQTIADGPHCAPPRALERNACVRAEASSNVEWKAR